jgi:hypothetical protein
VGSPRREKRESLFEETTTDARNALIDGGETRGWTQSRVFTFRDRRWRFLPELISSV